MFLMADDFLENVMAWRSLWLGGRLGSGKTCVSVAIAKWLLDHKLIEGVWSNFPVNLPPAHSLENCCFILDEAWQFIDARVSRNSYSLYGAWARKLGSFWLFPSIFPPDNRVRLVTCKREFQLIVSPVPLWFYTYAAIDGEPGHFAFAPESTYGLYDTKYLPTDDGGISAAVLAFVAAAGIETVHTRFTPSQGVAGVIAAGGPKPDNPGHSEPPGNTADS